MISSVHVCSAGGIALTTLVTSAVRSISLLAKSSNASLQLWALHSLLLIIEAAGLSYVPQIQVPSCKFVVSVYMMPVMMVWFSVCGTN